MNEEYVSFSQSETLKKCNKCGKLLPLSSFHKLKSGKFGVNGRCKECRARTKIYITPKLPNEEWRAVVGYEGLYEISNLGRVKRCENQRLLKHLPHHQGYYLISLYRNGVGEFKLLHRIIAEAFIPNPENKPCIDHINTIKSDNRIENLRWVTQKDNMNNPITKKKMSDSFNTELQRESQPSRSVDMLSMNNDYEQTFKSISEASRFVNGNVAAIHRCCCGKQNYAYGHKWKYNTI